jgi:hypothetical protein
VFSPHPFPTRPAAPRRLRLSPRARVTLALALIIPALLLAALSCTLRLAWYNLSATGGTARSSSLIVHAGVIQYDRTVSPTLRNLSATPIVTFNRQIDPGFRLNWSIHSTPASLRVDIPFAFLTLLTLALAAGVTLLRRYLRPPDPSLCPCGYPRHSLPPHAPCPECGRPTPPAPTPTTPGPAAQPGPPTPPSRPQDR